MSLKSVPRSAPCASTMKWKPLGQNLRGCWVYLKSRYLTPYLSNSEIGEWWWLFSIGKYQLFKVKVLELWAPGVTKSLNLISLNLLKCKYENCIQLLKNFKSVLTLLTLNCRSSVILSIGFKLISLSGTFVKRLKGLN